MNEYTEYLITAMDHDAFIGHERRVATYQPRRVRVEDVSHGPFDRLDMKNDAYLFETTEDFMQDAIHEILMGELNEFAS